MNKRKQIIFNIVIAIIGLGIGAYTTYYLIVEKAMFAQTVINKLEKEVTVTETGIADAVDKLYDSVVVVGSYKNDVLTASGTGFVYKIEGNKAYILTNHHVVAGAAKISAQFTDNKTHDITLVGSDEYSDIAVLSIDKDKIVAVSKLGSSDNSRLGDTVFTIGAPLGEEYSWTVTRGIISGKDRLVEISVGNSQTANWAMRVLQTDAAINSGNSGGPIANSNGEVIGVTNMKLVSSGVEGIAFAIPIEDAISTATELIESKKIERPILGIGTLDITDTQALKIQYNISLDSSIKSGAVVAYLQPGSVASEAGLKQGDVITKIGDYEITSSAKLKYYLYKYKVGSKVKIEFIRGTKTESVTVTLSQKAS